MTEHMNNVASLLITIIQNEFKQNLPTLDDIHRITDNNWRQLSLIYPISEEDVDDIKRYIASNLLHKIGPTISLKGQDDTHQAWYHCHDENRYYWERYKKYLQGKHWSTDIISRLNDTTDKVMDDLGNPKDHQRAFQRRGLLLGDVQSGKTATYTAICNKAADAGYRVIIVLAGMMENLRVQTQERLDAEFVGIDSKHSLDRRVNSGDLIGVGRIAPYDSEKRIAFFTSVDTDFNKGKLKGLGLSLRTYNGTALFVVKKNKSILDNLHKWLVDNNAQQGTDIIDLPLLLIDDEADNASVNTNSEDKDPTAINRAIRNILNCFRQASYLGITATPFANIFINPEIENDEYTRDLFPKDFLTVLPSPELYIGAEQIFGNGDADEWNEDERSERKAGSHSNCLNEILNTEQEGFFAFKHKKELANELDDLPPSLKEAIQYFVLATVISDIRKNDREHRSMLVNVSRFTKIQNRVAELITEYLLPLKRDIENYAQSHQNDALKIKSIASLKRVWDKHNLSDISGISWEYLQKNYLYKGIKRIKVIAVNQENGSKSLDYVEYGQIGMRVIAVGGNSLSRGITLEGLCVSYFYRNTTMYDTLLQMGRWFGYRPGYDDIFRVWMAEDAIAWYGFITDAVTELKSELYKMELQNQTPEQFGLKVRQAPGTLLITARNKMRTATLVSRPVTLSGRLIETPRLKGDQESIKMNEELCREFIKELSSDQTLTPCYFDAFTNAYIWKNVPKDKIVNLISNYITHPWNLNFQREAISKYIKDDDESLDLWDIAIPQASASEHVVCIEQNDGKIIDISTKGRPLEWDITTKNMLNVYGRHVRIGSGGCTKIGLSKQQITKLRTENGSAKDSTFLNVQRNPLMLIHIIHNTKKDRLATDPTIVFALGLGFPFDGKERTANYMVNVNALRDYVEFEEGDDDDN